MATAELAVGIMSVVVVLAIMLFAIGVGITHVRTQEAARAGARAAARGDSPTQVRSVSRRSLPDSQVTVRRSDQQVEVGVAASVRIPFLGGQEIHIESSSVAEMEPR